MPLGTEGRPFVQVAVSVHNPMKPIETMGNIGTSPLGGALEDTSLVASKSAKWSEMTKTNITNRNISETLKD